MFDRSINSLFCVYWYEQLAGINWTHPVANDAISFPHFITPQWHNHRQPTITIINMLIFSNGQTLDRVMPNHDIYKLRNNHKAWNANQTIVFQSWAYLALLSSFDMFFNLTCMIKARTRVYERLENEKISTGDKLHVHKIGENNSSLIRFDTNENKSPRFATIISKVC